MQMDGNIVFDSQGNPVSVNNAFVEVCGCAGGPPCTTGFPPTQKIFTCALGDTKLIGTGPFEYVSWKFGDKFVDVVSDGGFVPAGTRVQVIQVEGTRIVVKEV